MPVEIHQTSTILIFNCTSIFSKSHVKRQLLERFVLPCKNIGVDFIPYTLFVVLYTFLKDHHTRRCVFVRKSSDFGPAAKTKFPKIHSGKNHRETSIVEFHGDFL